MRTVATLALFIAIMAQTIVCHGATHIAVERVQHLLVVSVETTVGKRRFAVDTGAGITVIPRRLADEMGQSRTDSLTVKDYTNNEFRSATTVIKELSFGGETFSDVKAMVIDDDNAFFSCFGLDGIIGTNILKRFAIRFSESEIILGNTAEELGVAKTARRTPIRNFYPSRDLPGTPWVVLQLQNGRRTVKHPFMIDTGASTVSLHDWDRIKAKGIASTVVSTVGYSSSLGISGEIRQEPLHFGIIPFVVFGNEEVGDISATSSPMPVIGNDMLSFGDIVLDFPKCIAYFIPSCTNEGRREQLKNITPTFDKERGFIVGAVWDTQIEGVKPGDRIVELNGTDTSSWQQCNALEFTGKGEECVVETSSGRCRIAIRTIVQNHSEGCN